MTFERNIDNEFLQLNGNQLTLDAVIVRKHNISRTVTAESIDYIFLRLNNFKYFKKNDIEYVKFPNGDIVEWKRMQRKIKVTLLSDIPSKYDIYKTLHIDDLSCFNTSIVKGNKVIENDIRKKLTRDKLYICIRLTNVSTELGLHKDAITEEHKRNINNIFKISIRKGFSKLNEIYYNRCIDDEPKRIGKYFACFQHEEAKYVIKEITVRLPYFSRTIEDGKPIIIDDCGRKIDEDMFKREFSVIIKKPIKKTFEESREYKEGDIIPYTIDNNEFSSVTITLNFEYGTCKGIDKDKFEELTMKNGLNDLFVIKWEKNGNLPASYYVSNVLRDVISNKIESYKAKEITDTNNIEPKTLTLETDTIEGFEKVVTTYNLVGELNTLYGVRIDSYIVKRIDETNSNLYSLTKTDCKILGIEFQRGLQLMPKNIGWIEKSEEKDKIENNIES